MLSEAPWHKNKEMFHSLQSTFFFFVITLFPANLISLPQASNLASTRYAGFIKYKCLSPEETWESPNLHMCS